MKAGQVIMALFRICGVSARNAAIFMVVLSLLAIVRFLSWKTRHLKLVLRAIQRQALFPFEIATPFHLREYL